MCIKAAVPSQASADVNNALKFHNITRANGCNYILIMYN